ncbi:hypothetical protein MACH16_15720 [Marinomonas pontica]|uniref:ENT domain-containing protein n=1 Tax=Marinomonas pontica TaxID=264739 RepID=A0ABM8FCM3_9GAMM|nr:hypothetical protein MACH16_15720 [Marinomonas pontica]
MSNVNTYVRENVKNIGEYVYLAPDIPEKKLNNAVSAMKCEDLLHSIIAIQDATLFGKSDEGFIFTGDRFIHDKRGVFLYSEIEKVEYKEDVTVNAKGKESIKKYVEITKDGKVHKFSDMYGVKDQKLSDFLGQIVSDFSEFKNEKQAVDLVEMNDEFKINYLKLIANMTYEDDGDIDELELSEILLLSTRLHLSVEARSEVRKYISEIENDIEPVQNILSSIRDLSDQSQHKSIMISLAKDIVNTYYSSKSETNGEVPFLLKHKDSMELSHDDLQFAQDAVSEAFQILNDDVDDNDIRDNASKLASTAAAVGAPIAAVYISGSVVGLSASGVTSGLATLGLGMGMTGGLAILGAVGFLTFTGVRKFSGVNELDRFKVKQAMLNEALKQTHLTIKNTIEDINYLVEKLSEAMETGESNRAEVLKLKGMVAKFAGALQKESQKADVFENAANRTKCPKILDHQRLKNLCEGATKSKIYDFILERYEENEKGEYILKGSVQTEMLDRMSSLFESIGYFEMNNALKSKLQSKVKGVLS